MTMRAAWAAVAAAAVLMAGCTATAGDDAERSKPKESCGTVRVGIGSWVGYEANAAVVNYLARHELGCTVVEKKVTGEAAWADLAGNKIDVILENWGRDEMKKRYVDQRRLAVLAGVTGNRGVVGWYVPPWLVEAHPDIADWKNLNKYAHLFRTPETGSKGQLLLGDPQWSSNDEALLRNLKLNYQIKYAETEDALITAFRRAEAEKKPLIGYFYQPQWFLAEVPLVHVNLPPYVPGCDADPDKVACDYEPYYLEKVMRKEFAESGSPMVTLVKNFKWTDEDQNTVARDIAQKGLSPEAAAKKWVEAHPSIWRAWLRG